MYPSNQAPNSFIQPQGFYNQQQPQQQFGMNFSSYPPQQYYQVPQGQVPSSPYQMQQFPTPVPVHSSPIKKIELSHENPLIISYSTGFLTFEDGKTYGTNAKTVNAKIEFPNGKKTTVAMLYHDIKRNEVKPGIGCDAITTLGGNVVDFVSLYKS